MRFTGSKSQRSSSIVDGRQRTHPMVVALSPPLHLTHHGELLAIAPRHKNARRDPSRFRVSSNSWVWGSAWRWRRGRAAEKGTGLVPHGRLDKGLALMCRVGCLPTFSMREAALGTLADCGACRRRGTHPVVHRHRGGQGDLGPHTVLTSQRGPPGPPSSGLLCLAPIARAIPPPALARPACARAWHYCDPRADSA